MTDVVVQASFNSGEWSPQLFARVDIQKYRSGAALLENFYVDYRGGASTRPGTQYVLQAYQSATPVRLIPFQAAFNIGYGLEFGNFYIRFYFAGAPVVEAAQTVSGATRANPCVLTITGHDLAVGDWINISGVGGMTQLNGNYYSVLNTTTNTVTLGDLNGNNLDSSAYTAYTTGGIAQRVYTIVSPYAAADLATLKFAQATNEMVLCHPNYVPYTLSLVTATNWTLVPVQIGSTISAPTNAVATASSTLTSGSGNTTCYSYVVTAIDSNGQESGPSAAASLLNIKDIRTVSGSISISWTAVPGAKSYNVYESSVSYFGVIPSGVQYGYIGNTQGTTFIDSNIGQDFSVSPPIAQDPFVGGGVQSVAVTANGAPISTTPTVTTSGGSPNVAAGLQAILTIATASINSSSTSWSSSDIGSVLSFPFGVLVKITSVSSGHVNGIQLVYAGYNSSGAGPATMTYTDSAGGGASKSLIINTTWGVGFVQVTTSGAGYLSVPAIVFSAGTAAATATLAAATLTNPSVSSFFQQRLVMAASPAQPQTFWMSQPGLYFNFDTTNPTEPDNAITETIVDGVLQTIKSIVSATSGMLMFTDKAAWLINGGSAGSAVSPNQIVANKQSSVGANDLPPITANYDILFVQAKGSAVRDLAYNIYFSVFTGTDISITASHLFYGHNLISWTWAEEPFHVVWAVRDDGVMLCLTFLKEQEFIGWTHQTTQGLFQSVCSVTETTTYAGNVDAVYTVVQRVVNGNTVQYIERVADRVYPNGLSSAWCVDAGIQYQGVSTLSFQGGQHLAGLSVTGLATDNLGNVSIITPFAMPVNGQFTLPAPASPATGYTVVTVGLSFLPKLQTLAIDTGQAVIQGKVKHIPDVNVRVNQTLGLYIGSDFTHQVPMKDLVMGAVSSQLTGQSSQIVTGLYQGDALTHLDPSYNVPGQYCITQPNPYPATVLGVFPSLVVGDTD